MHTKKQKQKLRRFLLIKEIAMSTLAILCVVLLLFEHLERLSEPQLRAVEVFELSIGVIFLIEFLAELHYAKDKGKYWRHHWYFLIAAVPVPFQSLQWLRGIRAFRLLRLLKIFAHLDYEHNTRMLEK